MSIVNVKYPENLWLSGVFALKRVEVRTVAKQMGYSKGLISKIINGHYKGENVVPKLCKVLGVTPGIQADLMEIERKLNSR